MDQAYAGGGKMNATRVLAVTVCLLAAARIAASQESPRFRPVGAGGRLSLPVRTVTVADLVRRLTVKPRSEFETTPEFMERVRRVAPGDTFAIRIPVTAEGGACSATATYDADAQMLTIRLPSE